ncbi:UNVERIFIED_CONTAM: hypothetical protein PYX00_002637 [Menopon gallinae]|uniref:Uncharacterized protein n=1 Tax=Menopon gallinae TaxID=328185 RepID=A0AAW2HXG5_9NEOP
MYEFEFTKKRYPRARQEAIEKIEGAKIASHHKYGLKWRKEPLKYNFLLSISGHWENWRRIGIHLFLNQSIHNVVTPRHVLRSAPVENCGRKGFLSHSRPNKRGRAMNECECEVDSVRSDGNVVSEETGAAMAALLATVVTKRSRRRVRDAPQENNRKAARFATGSFS